MNRYHKQNVSRFGVVRTIIIALIILPALLLLSTYYISNNGDKDEERTKANIQQVNQNKKKSIGFVHEVDKIKSRSLIEEEEEEEEIEMMSESSFDKVRKAIGSEPIDGNWMLDCPSLPSPNYPKAYPIMDIINNWGPDRPKPVPLKHYLSLCRFDYEKDLEKALIYRDAEVPFILYNQPQAQNVVKKWSEPEYLEKLSGNKQSYKTEVSHNNHFMYHSGRTSNRRNKKNKDGNVNKNIWKPPTSSEMMTFKEFKTKAISCQERNCSADEKHYYFRITGSKMGHYIFNELPFYQPIKSNIFLKDPSQQRGIHCRFGMQGVIAENHYDGGRNMIGLFGGRRRYILSHPNQCDTMYLYPMDHPSGRHSGDACNFNPACKDSINSVDWSNPDLETFPKFKNLKANEVILSPGDFLYIPDRWFHYIISLELNYQCNTRSGRDNTYKPDLVQCGFN